MSHFKPWPFARVIAHRGGGVLAPENTIAAIARGHWYGLSAVEFDAVLAADDVPVLMHDETLERTTNGTGPVDALTAAQLGALDAGAWHSPEFAGEPVPTLEQAVEFCRGRRIWINCEIKPMPGAEARTGTVVAAALVRLYGDIVHPDGAHAENIVPAAPLLSSFARASREAARVAAPPLPRGLLVGEIPAAWQDDLVALDCVALHCNHKNLTAPLARAVKEAGYWLFCYTVNDPERARELLSWGVDAFCTDRIDLIGARFA
jgi:glycerophosphoryl diester phosphodiesterase